MKLVRAAVLLSIVIGGQAFAQPPTWDTTGNSLLSGTYYFRYVFYQNGGGQLSDAGALYGTINFSGSGTYTMSAQFLDLAAGQISPESLTGTYSMGAGGLGFLSDPLQNGVQIRGMVANGIFIGTTTESSGVNNLFVAGLIPSPTPSLSTFNGSYAMSYINYPDGIEGTFVGAQFTLNPTGAGTLGTVSIRGYFAGSTSVTGQQSAGLKYTVSNGATVVTFPNIANNAALSLVNGQEYLYQSPDGNFVFGGSPNQADMLVGVRTTSGGAPQLLNSSLYFNAGIYSDATGASCNALDLDNYYGAFNLINGTELLHSRIASSCSGTYSSVTVGSVPTTAGPTYSDPYDSFTIGNGGNVRIGFGQPPYLGLDVALAAPAPTATGSVFLNPNGVVNAGSFAPFTAGLSPGELITLFGTNLAPSTAQTSSSVFPTSLNGVTVLIDGIAAPIYYVSSTQISVIVPYAASTFTLATIQVKNALGTSNTVTEFMNLTTPGVQTYPVPNGLSDAAAVHLDGSIVTENHPALQGETISIFLTGLGAVFPPIQDGNPGSSTNLNFTTNTIAAQVGGVVATVGYAGLAPGSTGQYQMNITIPTGLTAGDNFLTIEAPDGFSQEATLPISSSTASGVAPAGTEVKNGQAQKPAQHRHPRPSQKQIIENPAQP